MEVKNPPYKKVIEDTVIFKTEDSGAALIAHLDGDDGDSGIFIRLQSWDESGQHLEAEQLRGKKVRITIELL